MGNVKDIWRGVGHPHELVDSLEGVWKSFRRPNALLEGLGELWGGLLGAEGFGGVTWSTTALR